MGYGKSKPKTNNVKKLQVKNNIYFSVNSAYSFKAIA